MTETPKTGVSVIIMKDDKVLMGKRINSHGNNTWAFPGGHIELFETLEECAKREVKEEVGLDIELIEQKQLTYTRDFFNEENKDYFTFYQLANYTSGEVKNMEPEKCEEWRWVEWNNMPEPHFIPVKNLIKSGYNPFELK